MSAGVPPPDRREDGWPTCPYCGEPLNFSGNCGCGYRARESL